jgi:hypothetical protein
MLTYNEVLAAYRELLEQNPGKALVIGEGNVALLLDDYLVCCPLEINGTFNVDDAYQFDHSAFIDEEGGWDGEGEQTRKAIENPVFIEDSELPINNYELPINNYTAFCQQADGKGTIWIGTVKAVGLDAASIVAQAYCATDWDCPSTDVHVLGIAAGDVEILVWNDLV